MKPQLRAIDPEHEHPRDRARRAVKRFLLDREKKEKGLKAPGVSNQHGDEVKPALLVDEVLKKSFKQIG